MKCFTIYQKADRWLTRWLSGSIFTWQQILRMTVPYVLDSLSIMLIGMLITALISKNGETSVAAVSLVGPITNLVVCMFNGIGAGGTVVVAQCCGTKDPEQVSKASGQVIWLTVLIGIVSCLPMLIFPRVVLLALYPAAEPAVLDKASVYLAGSAWSILPFTVYTAIYSVLRGIGESKKCLFLSVVINVAYLVFSVVFLNWLNLDIQGSVYALVLARVLGALAAAVVLFFWRPPIAFTLRRLFAFDRKLLRSTLKVSIPFGMEQIFSTCGNIVAGVYVVQLGTTAIATNSIANSLLGVLTAAASSAGNLAVTVVGRCVGAGERQEAKRYGRSTVMISLLLLALTAAVFYPALPLLLRQYNPTPEIYQMSVRVLLISLPVLLVFWPISNTMPYTLRAAGDTMFPSVFSLAVMWCVNIGLGYLLSVHLGLGLIGVWMSTWLSWTVRTLGFALRFRGKNWIRKAALSGKS